MSRPFWIDTDTASDDAVALIMALRNPKIDVVGISVVAGNVPLEMGVQNALYTRELCDRTDVPVFVGADAPLQIGLETAQNVHGIDGMGDIGLELSGRTPDEGDAVDRLIDASRAHDGNLTLVTLGPLTNIARAIERDPHFVHSVRRTVIMGAVGDHIGNITPAAEFNIWADPHAADVVVRSGLQIEFVGWDVSRKYAVVPTELATELRSLGNRIAEFAVDIQRVVAEFCAAETGLDGYDLPDPIAMACAIDPDVALGTQEVFAAVETESEITRGMVVFDVLNLLHREPNAVIVTEADSERFFAMLRDSVS